ncbi:GFA family protein [Rhizobium sp. LjRoot254]|uniref:GFA family protein n=1 Tax=Rhizobium sp. LjRoot254 TaxID=3342297 RepID=UPI003ED010D0
MKIRTGQCLCGRVHYEVRGEPSGVGLCHCADCRRESGSAFVMFAIWPRHAFSSTGDFSTYEGRSFCFACGARLFNLTDEEAELRVGSLDMAPTDLKPTYEIWAKRRENWLTALPDTHQHHEDQDHNSASNAF